MRSTFQLWLKCIFFFIVTCIMTEVFNGKFIVSVASILVFSVLFGFTQIYWLIQYKRNITNIVIQRRYGNIVILIGYSQIIRSLLMGIFYFLFWNNNDEYIYIQLILDLLQIIVIMLHLLRFHLISYNIKWMKFLMPLKWKNIIKDNYYSEGFYQKYKHKYGHCNWLIYRIVIPVIIVVVLVRVIPIIFNNSDISVGNGYIIHGFVAILMIIPSFILFYKYIKIPKNDNDVFHILCELKFILTFVIAQQCTVTVQYLLSNINISLITNIAIMIDITNFIAANIDQTCQCISFLLSTKWVLNKVKPMVQPKLDKLKTITYDVNEHFELQEVSSGI